jgi:hypothetical protein
MNTNEHIAYLWKICGIVNMIVEYILKKTVTIFADRYRYEKLKFYYITISNGKRFIKKGVQNNTLFKMPDLTDVVILMENSISLYP